jgi:hypothetical protein
MSKTRACVRPSQCYRDVNLVGASFGRLVDDAMFAVAIIGDDNRLSGQRLTVGTENLSSATNQFSTNTNKNETSGSGSYLDLQLVFGRGGCLDSERSVEVLRSEQRVSEEREEASDEAKR